MKRKTEGESGGDAGFGREEGQRASFEGRRPPRVRRETTTSPEEHEKEKKLILDRSVERETFPLDLITSVGNWSDVNHVFSASNRY